MSQSPAISWPHPRLPAQKTRPQGVESGQKPLIRGVFPGISGISGGLEGDCWGPRGSVCLVFRGTWWSGGTGGWGRRVASWTGWAGGEGYRWDGFGGVREAMGNPLRRAGTRANPHTRASVLRNPDLSREPGFPILRGSPGDPPSVFRVSQGVPRETGNRVVPGILW